MPKDSTIERSTAAPNAGLTIQLNTEYLSVVILYRLNTI